KRQQHPPDQVGRGHDCGGAQMNAKTCKSVVRRIRRMAFLMAAAGLLAVPASLSALFPSAAHAEGVIRAGTAPQRIKLGLNKSLVVDIPRDAYDILVANPAVADAVTRTARRIYLFGKQVGETNIFVFGPNGEQIASLDILVERD